MNQKCDPETDLYHGIFRQCSKTHYEDAYHLAGRNGTVVLGTHRMHGYLRVKYLKQGKVPPLTDQPPI